MKVRYDLEGISRLPQAIGVYIISYGTETGYVGYGEDVQERVRDHFNENMKGDYVEVILTDSIEEAQDREIRLIAERCPLFNKKKPDHCKNESALSSRCQLAIIDARILLLKCP